MKLNNCLLLYEAIFAAVYQNYNLKPDVNCSRKGNFNFTAFLAKWVKI